MRHELSVSADTVVMSRMNIQEDDDRVEIDILGSSRSDLVVIGTTSQSDIVSICHQYPFLYGGRKTYEVKQRSNKES